jgi:hypothetical protein
MMRAIRWQNETRTYAYDVKGSYRAQEKRVTQIEIDSFFDDIEDDRRVRECWNFMYSLHPAWFADKVLDMYELPKPPSRARRMPE